MSLNYLKRGLVVFAFLNFPIFSMETKKEPQQSRYENLELFQKVLNFVETNYVDEVKNKELMYGAIKGMMETLDPHSNFLPPELYREMKTDTSGKFGGLGIEIGIKEGVLTIISPIEDTPAWKAGLKPNDRIVKVNGESTKGLTLVEGVSKMRGKRGSAVKLTIAREGWEATRDIEVTRDTIKVQSVKSETVEPGYGYVRLSNFNENGASDVRSAIEKLSKKEKLSGLVFDLRMNPGGLLEQAVDISSLFIEEGQIVSTIGRNREQKDVKFARRNAVFKDLPLVVLVNSSTASAAEIVAGALQDHHRAVILGQPSFGKGSVQTVVDLGQDMGLKLTIARYYTPSGRSIQEKGVQPDILLDQYDTRLLAKAKVKQETFRERDLKGHLAGKESEPTEETKATPPGEEFKREELASLLKGEKTRSAGKDKEEDDDLTPLRFNPKEDFQVKEAVHVLKSFDVFKKLSQLGEFQRKMETAEVKSIK